jgi:hypothetical protein
MSGVDSPIGALSLVMVNPTGRRVAIRVEVGRPKQERGAWRCPVLVAGIDDTVRYTCGEDSLQALCLALRRVGFHLQSAVDAGNQLMDDEEHSFPLEAYFRTGTVGIEPGRE